MNITSFIENLIDFVLKTWNLYFFEVNQFFENFLRKIANI